MNFFSTLFTEENNAAKKAYELSKELLLRKNKEQKRLEKQLEDVSPQPIEE